MMLHRHREQSLTPQALPLARAACSRGLAVSLYRRNQGKTMLHLRFCVCIESQLHARIPPSAEIS